MAARLSLEQQLPQYSAHQEARRAELKALIAAEVAAMHARIEPYDRELREIERDALPATAA